MKGDRESHPEKVKQSSLHVNCLMSKQNSSQDAARASPQIIISDKHTVRAAFRFIGLRGV